MARFLTRSQLARVTPVLSHHCRSSLLFSTTPKMKIPVFGNPNKYLKRIAERNEKHRKVQELASEVVILSCESTAKGGVCDVYVVGTTHYTPESCREVQAIMSYLKPPVLFLELCEGRSYLLQPIKLQNISSGTDMAKAVMNKRTNILHALETWRSIKYVKEFKIETSEVFVAYQEAKKYGSKVILGDRPMKVTDDRHWRKMSLWQKTFALCLRLFAKEYFLPLEWEILVDERDKYMAHRLFEVARKNSSVVAIVGRGHLEGLKKYWKQSIEVEDLMTIPPPSNSYLQCLGVVVAGVATIILVIYFHL